MDMVALRSSLHQSTCRRLFRSVKFSATFPPSGRPCRRCTGERTVAPAPLGVKTIPIRAAHCFDVDTRAYEGSLMAISSSYVAGAALALALGIAACSSKSNDDTPSDVSVGGSRSGPTAGTGAIQHAAAGTGTAGAAGAASNKGGGTYVEPAETLDLNATATPVVTLRLEIPSTAIQDLDQNPYSSPDVTGAFVDESGVRYDGIAVNYRGGYTLKNLIDSHAQQRNWKLKFTKDKPYQNRREWNLTYEPDIRQRLTYWLMHLANVKLPSIQHVVLLVNGTVSGLFLKYEDPDNKPWLLDKFGDDSGDLYKAAYDIPDETRYFATLEVLGTTDADYAMHYRKKTNDDEATKATDYSALRAFIADLNQTPDANFEAFLRQSFDVDKFLGYLVVGNFVSNWDSLPQRPKNYWLYQISATGRWVFIPWDLDATFQSSKFTLDPMGTDASVFYQFDGFVEYAGRLPEEGTNRPLITRMMKVPAFRSAYVTRYRQALSTFLAKDYLLARVSELCAIATSAAQPSELQAISDAKTDIEHFVNSRSASVTAELASVK
jgi:spore coat protein CotH